MMEAEMRRPKLTVEDLIRETQFSTEYRAVFCAPGKRTGLAQTGAKVLSGASPDRTGSAGSLRKSQSTPGLTKKPEQEPEKPALRHSGSFRVTSEVGSRVPDKMLWKGLVLGGYRGPRMSQKPKSELSFPTDVWDESQGKMMRSEYMLSFREQGPWGAAGIRGCAADVSNRRLMAELAKETRDAMQQQARHNTGAPPRLPGAAVPSTLQAFPPAEMVAFRATNKQ